jgi:hypothetical protein
MRGNHWKAMHMVLSENRERVGLLTMTLLILFAVSANAAESARPRVIVTTDGEIDDECSPVRFLLYANEWDIEGIITTS